MTNYSLPYGHGYREVNLPDSIHADFLSPQDVDAAADPLKETAYAIDHPNGTGLLNETGKYHSAAIAINDKTRPVPHHLLLPPLLQHLEAMGIAPAEISLIIATGTHLPMKADEFGLILPEDIIKRYSIYSHDTDANDLVFLGKTTRETPIWVNRRYMAADLRIVIGNIEPHHFMGYSGGVKTAAIGLAGRETINKNHSLLPHPNARTAHYYDNPMRKEVEEIGKIIGIHFAVNAILNNEKEIVKVVAGDPSAVMETGIPLANSICQIAVNQRYDLVIASPGGHPKDINLYQSQKALTHSAIITKDGGSIILLADCPEGPGSQGFIDFMKDVTSFDQLFKKFDANGFEIGPHKAFQIARDASRVKVNLFSSMTPEVVSSLLLTPVINLEETISQTLAAFSSPPSVAIMPIATITIPTFSNSY